NFLGVAAFFDRPLGLAASLSLGDIPPLVPELFASGQSDLHLGPSFRCEVDSQRDQRKPLLLHLTDEPANLAAMEEEFARARRLVVPPIAVRVRAHVHVVQEDLAVLDAGEAILEVEPSLADRLDLGAREDDARLKGLLNVVVVTGFPIGGNHFLLAHASLPPCRILHYSTLTLKQQGIGRPLRSRRSRCQRSEQTPAKQWPST